MKNIELLISESIKNGRWLYISYKNNLNQITYYWISIYDIDLKKKNLRVNMFNFEKSYNAIYGTIKFDKILSAQILDFTTYNTPKELINKIETNKEDAKWLKYESFNNNILRYYIKCNNLDNDPFQNSSFLIDGIDSHILLNNKKIFLNEKQEKKVLQNIYKYNIKKKNNSLFNFSLSFLSIDNHGKKYVVLYYNVYFNPTNRTLKIDEKPEVNRSFLTKGKRHTLSYYIDMDTNEFVDNITNHLNDYLKDYTELIRSNLDYPEIINELPEFMILERNICPNLEDTYNIIENKQENNTLEYPLKAFFGNTNRFGIRKKEPSIIIYDDKVNIDQMRVIYNTMKYPVTYVEGPPGTGKTQTILNVILSAFFNTKTILVCSSNNKPMNGILEKLTFSYHKNKDIPFPYLRLGNRNEVLKATKRILELYHYQTRITPDDKKINFIKEKTNNENKDLVKYLEIYEKKKELKYKIESAKRFYDTISNKECHLAKIIQKEILPVIDEYNNLINVSNDDILNLVTSIKNNNLFKKFLYLESIKYIKKLKSKRCQQLIDICYIEDEEERVTSFNRWCSEDNNIKILEDCFPVIITTNISAARLGSANHTFDLVIMDEAGQCNSAIALLPIARAKQLLLVGDSNQLKPIVVLEDNINNNLKKEFKITDDYDYSKNSILDIMKYHDNISKKIMLTYHYRCGKKIINFSNKRFYNGKLNLDFITDDGNLSLLNVKNMNSKLKNENYEEAKAIIDYIKRNKINDASIITPFRNQQKLISEMLEKNNLKGITCGTIHQIQGAEKDTIIISSSISPKTSKKTFDWIKNNSEITNVAVTRAKKNLIVVSDIEALIKLSDKTDDLYNLVKYIYNNGNIDIELNKSHAINIGNSNGSKNENYFYETICHFCSVNNRFEAKRNVKLSDLFKNDPILSSSKLEFDVVLYIISNNSLIPKIAIELQGGEHFGNLNREKCDTKKMQICKEKNITLLQIPNSFAKSYETIRELIFLTCGKQIEQLELF